MCISRGQKCQFFEKFCVVLDGWFLKDISNTAENKLRQTKNKLRNTCDNYSKLKVSYIYRKVIKELPKIHHFVIFKAGKGTGVTNHHLVNFIKEEKYIDYLKLITSMSSPFDQFSQIQVLLIIIQLQNCYYHKDQKIQKKKGTHLMNLGIFMAATAVNR